MVSVSLAVSWYVVVDDFEPVDEIPCQLLCVVEVARTSGGVGDDDLVVVEEPELVDAVAVDGSCEDVHQLVHVRWTLY